MEHILLAGDYPNLTYLELFNFKQKIVCYFTDKSAFQHIFQRQITDLILHNNDENRGYIHNLKCFSLTSYNVFWDTNDLIASLLRRMTHLEKLTLYLRMGKSSRLDSNTSPYVDGTYLQNEILVLMSQLHTFNFYISTQTLIDYSCSRISSNNIQQTFKNIKYEQTACIIDYFGAVGTICHVDLLPFTFTHLEMITTHFPFILFNSVTHLSVYDFIPFEHEFFMQISQAFPLLKCFFTENWRM
ncbi:unnamed protein product [Rotaria sordida]|uniref:Uncharacterized protein n=1 Tax=Rotaria sordida TaxID=392033 RepID=A0A814QZY2_9BILA|nr:unnamed protein product [Rotaria sordida]